MNPSAHKLLKHLTGADSIEEASIPSLQKLCEDYPFFPVAQFLLARKLSSVATSEPHSQQLQKAALYVPNPMWLHLQLREPQRVTVVTNTASVSTEEIHSPEQQVSTFKDYSNDDDLQAAALLAKNVLKEKQEAHIEKNAEEIELAPDMAEKNMTEVYISSSITETSPIAENVDHLPEETIEHIPENQIDAENNIDSHPPVILSSPESKEAVTISTNTSILKDDEIIAPASTEEELTRVNVNEDHVSLTEEITVAENTLAEIQEMTALEFTDEYLPDNLIDVQSTKEQLTVSHQEAPSDQINDTDHGTEVNLFAGHTDNPLDTNRDTELPDHHSNKEDEEPDEHEKMFRNIKAMLDSSAEEAKADVKGSGMPIDPYYTIDYFASQGIKLDLDQHGDDQLGKHLKKFTHWLKQMKKLGPEDVIAPSEGSETEEEIQQIADSSNKVREVVTEAMAQVLEKQGKNGKAIELYTKLSFLYPHKSTYFADRIKKLKGD